MNAEELSAPSKDRESNQFNFQLVENKRQYFVIRSTRHDSNVSDENKKIKHRQLNYSINFA